MVHPYFGCLAMGTEEELAVVPQGNVCRAGKLYGCTVPTHEKQTKLSGLDHERNNNR